jgi:hypothetical protein
LQATAESEIHVTWVDNNPTEIEDDAHDVPNP